MSNDPLHGITLERIIIELHEKYGWEELANRIESIFGKKPPKERYVPPPLPAELAGPSSFEQQLGVTKLPPGRT